eukprot:TRINITY_DN2062_c0_g1_i1.p1 TRINITY_DN2062_c0_g1~~TRINITY_DN2062_c0_g1_i1.p1  ORF type:complete len:134 (+),score=39.42 TRINITY_DN2062_c0_g1_i1:140-541(+)
MSSLTVSFRIDGAVTLTARATGSKHSWKLPPKENILLRIPRNKLDASAKEAHQSPSRASARPGEESEAFSEEEAGLEESDSELSDDGDSEQPTSKKRKKILTARQRSLADGAELAPLMSIQGVCTQQGCECGR